MYWSITSGVRLGLALGFCFFSHRPPHFIRTIWCSPENIGTWSQLYIYIDISIFRSRSVYIGQGQDIYASELEMLSLHRSEPIDYSVDVDLDLNILLVFEILCGSQK